MKNVLKILAGAIIIGSLYLNIQTAQEISCLKTSVDSLRVQSRLYLEHYNKCAWIDKESIMINQYGYLKLKPNRK